MKINSIQLSRLRNDEVYTFHLGASALAAAVDSELLKPLCAVYTAAFAKLKTAIDVGSEKSTAGEARDADAARDTAWRGCNAYIKAVAGYSPDAAERAAADKIAVLFEKYKNPVNLSLSEETSVLDNLIESVEAQGTDAIEAAGFGKWLADLKSKQDAYKTAAKTHVSDAAAKVLGEVKTARAEADEAYSSVVTMAEALAVVQGEDAFAKFASELNVIIDRQNRTMKNRSAKSASASPQGED
ncbi:MAG: DUF6261 family protein [Bacteroides sp.]|nr:DUF6261 family protein [Prevotella sp.]MCM1408424.1 DUF6261 family protein [Treponema brennaborense]MCM1469414.1 DUF6261 family protein [Bacteroides sp.]